MAYIVIMKDGIADVLTFSYNDLASANCFLTSWLLGSNLKANSASVIQANQIVKQTQICLSKKKKLKYQNVFRI